MTKAQIFGIFVGAMLLFLGFEFIDTNRQYGMWRFRSLSTNSWSSRTNTEQRSTAAVPALKIDLLHDCVKPFNPIFDDPEDKALEFINIRSLPEVTPPFLPEYQNPCWRTENEDRPLLCLPYFYLTGFPNTGTTDMVHLITSHPLVTSGKFEELNFFNKFLYNWMIRPPCKNVQEFKLRSCLTYWYASEFYNETILTTDPKHGQFHTDGSKRIHEKYPLEAARLLRMGQETFKYPRIVGDFTTTTASGNTRWRKLFENLDLQEPKFLSMDLLRAMNPKAKYIVLLREPVSRTFNYFHDRDHQTISKQFIQDLECCRGVKSIFLCAMDMLQSHEGSPFVRSLYVVFIREWFKRIPRRQFLFMRAEDNLKNRTRALERVFHFLNVPMPSPEAMKVITDMPMQNVHPKLDSADPKWVETAGLLRKYFQPFNDELAVLLGDVKYTWTDTKTRIV